MMNSTICRQALLLCLAAAALLHPGRALAQSCSATTTTVAFGNVDVVANSQNYQSSYSSTAANVQVTCSVGLLSLGSIKFSACINIAGGSTSTPRTMLNGSNSLSYNLYSDSAHTMVWGASPGTPAAVETDMSITSILLGGSTSTTTPIYGYLLPTQNTTAVPDSYAASPSATVTYNYSYAVLGTPAAPPSCTTGLSPGSGGGDGTTSFTLNTSATVTKDCTVSANPLSFGSSVGVLSSAITATTTISATCTNTGSYTIALNKGVNGSLTNREMTSSGGAVVNYQLYMDSGYSIIWGDGTSGTSTTGATGTGSSQSYTVYGEVPAQTTPAPGSYSDTITVTVSY
jgi:spore coat protein U-like protein